MSNKKSLKKIVFHSSFEEQMDYGQQYATGLSEKERLIEMYRLNRKIFGEKYGKISTATELFAGIKDEPVEDFFPKN